MKLKVLFQTLANRAGISDTDAKLTAMIDTLPDVEVDDTTVANPLVANLITEGEAENRESIKKKFVAQALNGIDSLLDPALTDLFDPAELETLKSEKRTTARLAKLIEKAKTIKATGGSQADTAKVIADLNTELATLKTAKDTEIASLNNRHQRERFFDGLASKVITRADVTDYAKQKQGKRVVGDFEETLTAVGGVLDVATGKIMKAADPALELYIDNKVATVDGLLDKTLKDNDYIKKADTPPAKVVAVETAKENPGVPAALLRNLEKARAKMNQAE